MNTGTQIAPDTPCDACGCNIVLMVNLQNVYIINNQIVITTCSWINMYNNEEIFEGRYIMYFSYEA